MGFLTLQKRMMRRDKQYSNTIKVIKRKKRKIFKLTGSNASITSAR